MKMTLVMSLHSGDPDVICNIDSEYEDLQVPDVNIKDWTVCKCYSAYILV